MRARLPCCAVSLVCLAAVAVCAAGQQSLPADPVAALIASLEQQYAAADALYRNGRLDEARAGFNATIDRLLASSYSIRDQPRLQQELDSLLDRVHSLESDVIASGGLSNQIRQTPLERIPELTFPVDPALRAEIEKASEAALSPAAGPALPLVLNDAVIRYIHYFSTSGRKDIEADFRRAGRYRSMIESTLRSVGVPTDLLFLAQLESSYDPRLVSRAGARGMWQFMASRSDDYGLKRTRWVDERQDPVKSTLAAARHLKDLFAEFGDWDLAMAAYDAGPANIQRIVARTGYADYWKLYSVGALPRYLRNYVPVILATAIIARDPAKYGISVANPEAPDAADVETIAAPLDLRLAAECAQVTVGDLQHLNPSLLHYEVPAGFALRLPQNSGSGFVEALNRVPPVHRLAWRLHWARSGDTWSELAGHYHIALASLRRANQQAGTSLGSRPRTGSAVVLPLAAAASRTGRATPRTSAAKVVEKR